MTEPTPAEPISPSVAPALSYATPPPPPPSVVAAVVLCLPGTVCWLSLVWILMGAVLPSVMRFGTMLMRLLGPGFLPKLLICWGVAIVAAIVSLALYVRHRPKPWYVRLNLVINVAGLLFTIGVFVLIAVLN